MITTFGAVLLVVMILFVMFWRQHFIWFLSAMIPFPQTAMFVVAGQGISPFYAAAIVASLLGLGALTRNIIQDGPRFVPFRGVETKLLAFFALYATLITLIGPAMFRGVGVITPRGSISDQLATPTPLDFSISNVAQLAYLLLGVGLIIYVMSLKVVPSRVLEAGIWVGLGFTLVNGTFLNIGVPFPRDLFDTMPTIYYQSGGRLRGPFAEPSVLGAFLVAAMSYLLAQAATSRGRTQLIAVVGVAIGMWEFALSTSGTTLVAGAIVAVIGVVIAGNTWVQRGLRGIDGVSLTVLGLGVLALAFSDRVTSFILALVSNKLASDSFVDRTGADGLAWQIALETYGVGVGLGSNRPSSFFFMMLSCAGLVGTVLFFWLVISAAIRTMIIDAKFRPSAWALLGVVTAMSIAKADLATPMLWMALGICMWVCSRGRPREQRTDAPYRERRNIRLG